MAEIIHRHIWSLWFQIIGGILYCNKLQCAKSPSYFMASKWGAGINICSKKLLLKEQKWVIFYYTCLIWLFRNINNGVYRAGFATSQEAYNVAVRDVFSALDKVNVSGFKKVPSLLWQHLNTKGYFEKTLNLRVVVVVSFF